MSTDHLPNYIRSARKATGLSVKDLAHLLGNSAGSCVSHYESFGRRPSLATAILLHVALERPLEDLFPGLHADAKRLILERADALVAKEFKARLGSARLGAREQWLERLAGGGQESLPL